MLKQELGDVNLVSVKYSYCKYLHMNQFLSLYNFVLKSFFLNERRIDYLTDVSLKERFPVLKINYNEEMETLKGCMMVEDNPYRTYLCFPILGDN